MSHRRPVKPKSPGLHRLRVIRAERVSPSFHRVTVTGESLASFEWLGFDHWFRLFVPTSAQIDSKSELRLPGSASKLWYAQYLAMPSHERPHCSNYTVRAYRSDTLELDIDFVVHLDETGEQVGRAALWARSARPGDALGILDEGRLFNPPVDTEEVHLVADETGLPAVEGILRSLAPDTRGTVIQEVASLGDRRDFVRPDGIEVTWCVREAATGDAHPRTPGAIALSELRRRSAFHERSYAFVAGEAGLATNGRRHLHGEGVAKERISFSGYWKA